MQRHEPVDDLSHGVSTVGLAWNDHRPTFDHGYLYFADKVPREVWFSYGAWISETMRRRHGGHWLMMGDDPHTWYVGFSKVFLQVAPFVFAEQLLRMGSGATRKIVSEIERIRHQHVEQTERDKRQSLATVMPARSLGEAQRPAAAQLSAALRLGALHVPDGGQVGGPSGAGVSEIPLVHPGRWSRCACSPKMLYRS